MTTNDQPRPPCDVCGEPAIGTYRITLSDRVDTFHRCKNHPMYSWAGLPPPDFKTNIHTK